MFKMNNLSITNITPINEPLGGQCVNFHENREKSKEVLDKITNV